MEDQTYMPASRRSILCERGFLLASQEMLKTDVTVESLASAEQTAAIITRQVIQYCLFASTTGQGSRWPEADEEDFAIYPEYERTMEFLDTILKKLEETRQGTL